MKFPLHRFHELKLSLVFQVGCCGAFIAFVLFLMGIFSNNSVEWAIGATSLASSAYGVFVVPHSAVARPRSMFLAYGIATIIGFLLHVLLGYFSLRVTGKVLFNVHIFWVLSAIAVALTMVLMIFMGAHHPPATGIALCMTTDVKTWQAVAVIWISLSLLIAIRILWDKQLKDLIE